MNNYILIFIPSKMCTFNINDIMEIVNLGCAVIAGIIAFVYLLKDEKLTKIY